MILSELITAVNQYLRGLDDDVPTAGDDEYTYWLAVANRKQQEWARDSKQKWASLWADATLAGTISAGDQTYDLGATLLVPSDEVYVTTTGGEDVYFSVIKPEERRHHTNAVYISGSNPQELTFTDEITASSDLVGGTIHVPGYYTLADLATASDTVLVDDPNWLALATAADVAFNDIIYEDRAEGLNARANNLYTQMASNNRRNTYGSPRRVPVGNSYRIHGPTARNAREV